MPKDSRTTGRNPCTGWSKTPGARSAAEIVVGGLSWIVVTETTGIGTTRTAVVAITKARVAISRA